LCLQFLSRCTRARDFAFHQNIKTSSVANAASYSVCIRVLSTWEAMLTTHLHQVPRLRMKGRISPLPKYAFTVWTGTTLPLYTNIKPWQPPHIQTQLHFMDICLSDFCIIMWPLFAFIYPMTFYPHLFTSNIICSPVLLVTCRCPHALSHSDGLPLYCSHCQSSLKGPCCLLWYSIHILSPPIILKIQIWDVMLCPCACICQQPEVS
jgi:hypothetical protein